MTLAQEHNDILNKIQELYKDIFTHNGFGELKVEMRFLKKGQKEIVIRCGKDFRYVVDYDSLGPCTRPCRLQTQGGCPPRKDLIL